MKDGGGGGEREGEERRAGELGEFRDSLRVVLTSRFRARFLEGRFLGDWGGGEIGG